ncbi:MAG: cob(I)yrinic acid a,c-diamide adenosyltransferase [Planctomycetota bacterium]
MKIYTRTGDEGETGLYGGGRVSKHSLRVEAYGAVDELNASIGVARSAGTPERVDELLGRIQVELFDVGADLATPPDSKARAEKIVRVAKEQVEVQERAIDELEATLPPMDAFILPGGALSGSSLHLARTICRRAERRCVALASVELISEYVVPYLNRLSDLLFVMARVTNAAADRPEEKWLP